MAVAASRSTDAPYEALVALKQVMKLAKFPPEGVQGSNNITALQLASPTLPNVSLQKLSEGWRSISKSLTLLARIFSLYDPHCQKGVQICASWLVLARLWIRSREAASTGTAPE